MALDFGKLNFSTSFNPTSAFPIDARCYFESLTAATTAVASAEAAGNSTTVYYFGQQIAVVENSVATLYIIEKVTDETEKGYHGGLKEVGSKTLGDENSIALSEEGILSIVGFENATQNQVPYVKADGKIGWKTVGELVTDITVAGDEKTITVSYNTTTKTYTAALKGASGASTSAVLRKAANNTYEWVTVYSQAEADALLLGKVDKVANKSLVSDDEITKLAGVSAGANKTTVTTEKSGNIEIDGVSKQVIPDNIAIDANYKHISVSAADGVSDGTNTYKYDDTALSGRVTSLETTVGDSSSGLVKGLADEATTRANADTALDERIQNLEARGRFLSSWEADTGLPSTYPTVPSGASYPYTYSYKAGDYYVVGKVGTSGNKKPSGTGITKNSASSDWTVASVAETAEVKVGDYYLYDGSKWVLIENTTKTINWGAITGTLANQTDLQAALDAKVDVVTGKSLVDDTEITKLAGVSAQANKTTVTTEKSGNIEIDGVSKQVIPDNIAIDANYKHITVTSTSVSDGTTTFNKYDDTALAGRVTTAEGKITTLEGKVGSADDTASASGSLFARIKAEVSARSDADSTLQTNIDAEATARQAADTTLQTNIDAKVSQSDYDTKIAELTTSIGTKADTSTVTAIDGRLTTAEGKITTLEGSAHTHGNKTILDGIGADNLLDTTGNATKTKLAGIEAEAEVNKVNEVNGTTNEVVVTADTEDATKLTVSLAATVKTSLGKADTAVQSVASGSANGTIKVDGTDVAVTGLGDLAFKSDVAETDLASALATKLNAKADTVTVNAALATKQDTLTAGANVTITNNVVAVDISVINGGAASLE